MRIGELARRTGVSARSLRYYEQQGLLTAVRLGNGYREYDEQAVLRVAFIQDLYGAGVPSEVIREILPCSSGRHPTGDCSALYERVRQIRDRLAQQERLIGQRREMLDSYLSGAASPADIAVPSRGTAAPVHHVPPGRA
ncbi:MerR family transcriptional regulator [Micromonospora sp. WMMD714]|uniref:MerR family transcriptional regulator n=1 Tax=Micromonospora sp. WMMD714 TaxID=3016097 RepID=UPI002499B732|nr:MerR family transcriptional regulator [Micromonospora sp. WMMD714]WFE65057.1 MerR family transcriptional regulator [Micromonospora sp. WMMD714]